MYPQGFVEVKDSPVPSMDRRNSNFSNISPKTINQSIKNTIPGTLNQSPSQRSVKQAMPFGSKKSLVPSELAPRMEHSLTGKQSD